MYLVCNDRLPNSHFQYTPAGAPACFSMDKMKAIVLPLLMVLLSACSNSSPTRDTIGALWQSEPERIRSLLHQLDFSKEELGAVHQFLRNKDTLQACQELLNYYQGTDRAWVIEALDPLSYEEAAPIADRLLADSLHINGVVDNIPRNPDGSWKWDHLGPESDAEFAYSLNAHKYLPALYVVWQKRGDHHLVELFNEIINDWVGQHPLPARGDSIYLVLEEKGHLDYRDIGEVEWRTLDTGRRLGAAWPQLFYAFQDQTAFTPATRLLMLSSLAEQADYLQQYHKSGHNWTTMEMNGLALAGLAFPEFRKAAEWAGYALDVMSEEINRQVYPDGVQTEISTKTQWVALQRFESLAENFKSAGRNISPAYRKRIIDMYHYLAYCMRPDGHQPLNNDSDREDLRPRVLAAAEKYSRPDWAFIATNGRQGENPESKPSVAFPWAGIQVMRSGWEAQAVWAFFDQGPYGTGHQHRDMLHLSIAAFGKDLLVDGGRYTHQDYFSFDPATWRGYFRSSWSHNVILVDDQGQRAGPLLAEEPLKEGIHYIHHSNYDFATGTFLSGFENTEGKIKHTRSVLYLKDQLWLVVDDIETDRPRKLSALWHLNPMAQVVLNEDVATTTDPDGANLRILPLGDLSWHAEVIKAQEKPVIQGWYSPHYGEKLPNPTLVYETEIPGSRHFAWFIVAAAEVVPDVPVRYEVKNGFIDLSFAPPGKKEKRVRFPLSHDGSGIQVD